MYNCTKVSQELQLSNLMRDFYSHCRGLKLPAAHVWFERARSDKSRGGRGITGRTEDGRGCARGGAKKQWRRNPSSTPGS